MRWGCKRIEGGGYFTSLGITNRYITSCTEIYRWRWKWKKNSVGFVRHSKWCFQHNLYLFFKRCWNLFIFQGRLFHNKIGTLSTKDSWVINLFITPNVGWNINEWLKHSNIVTIYDKYTDVHHFLYFMNEIFHALSDIFHYFAASKSKLHRRWKEN